MERGGGFLLNVAPCTLDFFYPPGGGITDTEERVCDPLTDFLFISPAFLSALSRVFGAVFLPV